MLLYEDFTELLYLTLNENVRDDYVYILKNCWQEMNHLHEELEISSSTSILLNTISY